MTSIAGVETFLVAPRWLFVRVETDSGIVGWGEATCEGRSETVRTAVEQLSELLIGQDALRIEDHWQVMTKGSLLPRRPHPGQRGLRPRPGAVGHRRQAVRRAGAPAARRPGARPDPGLRLGRRRRAGRGGRPHPRAGRGRPHGGEDERQRPDEPARHRRRDRRRGRSAWPPPARCSATTATSPSTSTAGSPWPTPRRVAPLLEPYRPFFLEEPVRPGELAPDRRVRPLHHHAGLHR